MKKNKSEYSTEFKMSVLKKLQSGEIKTVEEARRVYSIGGKSTIQRWSRELNSQLKHGGQVIAISKQDEPDKLYIGFGKSYLIIIKMGQ